MSKLVFAKTRKPSAELNQEQTQQAITAMHCTGCPYKLCLGSKALMTYQQQTRTYREGDGR